MTDPFKVVRDFEADLCEYTGAPYCVVVNSCTAALRLALAWEYREKGKQNVVIPRKTYPSVAEAILWAKHRLGFNNLDWSKMGYYPLWGTEIMDCARWLDEGMYSGRTMCLSFHPQKPLALSHGGGAILHSDPRADEWYRRFRFDGRKEGVATNADYYTMIAEHDYVFPPLAAEGIQRLSIYSRRGPHTPMLEGIENYPDLTEHAVFMEAP